MLVLFETAAGYAIFKVSIFIMLKKWISWLFISLVVVTGFEVSVS